MKYNEDMRYELRRKYAALPEVVWKEKSNVKVNAPVEATNMTKKRKTNLVYKIHV